MDMFTGIAEELAQELVTWLEPMMLVKPHVKVVPPGKNANYDPTRSIELAMLLNLQEDISNHWRAFIAIPTHRYQYPPSIDEIMEVSLMAEYPEPKKPITFVEDIIIVGIEFDSDLYLTKDSKLNVVAALSEQGVYIRR